MPTRTDDEPEVIEVEAERLPPRDEPRTGGRKSGPLDPVLAGLLMDVADFLTRSGVPRFISLPVGAFTGYLVGSAMRLPFEKRLLMAAVGAVYCSLPNTFLLPLGTLVGMLSRLGILGK